MTPIQPRALKVEGGRVTHVQHEGLPGETNALETPPDGTYLRLDYVTDVVNGLRAQHDSGSDGERVLGGLLTFFQSRAL